MTHEDLVAGVRAADAALGSERDLKTDAERAIFLAKKNHCHKTLSVLVNARDPDKHELKLREMQRVHPIVLAAQAQIELLITEMPDYRRNPDPKERSKGWAYAEGLIASKRVLVSGVEFMGGIARVPEPLRSILGTEIMPDGRVWNVWYGSLPEIDAEIARLTPLVEARKAAYEQAVADAEAIVVGVTV
jgi:hypothetical protein